MMKAIIYTSNTGFTKRYAEMLGTELNIQVYDWESAKNSVPKGSEVIYMGWVMAGGIKNYKKAKKKCKILATCSVGMSKPDEKQYQEIIQKNEIKEPLFYLQGGFDKSKLKGIYGFMMNSMEKMIKSGIEAKENKTEQEMEMLEMMDKGKDCVKKENLDGIIEWHNRMDERKNEERRKIK